MMHVNSTHIPFTIVSHMIISNFKIGEKYSPTLCPEGKAPVILVTSTNIYHSGALVDPIYAKDSDLQATF